MRADTDIFDIGPFGWPPAVMLCHDLSATAWLNDPRLWAGGWRRYVGNLIPRGYDRYIRLNHPAWIDPETDFPRMMWDQHRRRLKPVSWAEVAAWSGRSLKNAWIIADLVPDTADPKTKPFDQEPWGLSPVVLEKLLPVLRTLTATPDRIWMGFCDTTGEWIRCGKADVHDDPDRPDYWERRRLRQEFCREIGRLPRFAPPGWAPSGRTYWLAVGPLESVYDLSRGIYSVEPFIWWPDDRAWCVFHDIDLDFSLLGTTSKGSEEILNLDGIEAYEVQE